MQYSHVRMETVNARDARSASAPNSLAAPDAMAAAAILRALATQVSAGALDGRAALPYLLGAVAALEAQTTSTGEDARVLEDPPE